ncbi:hypothetical protein LJB81_04680, partial [Desulfovibrio sp. OttesenSCG-928-M14]|nr:hypothetical protein [Desulfovibrio sp. OttesenSCG-928-M14]
KAQTGIKIKTPIKSIRAYCLNCSGDNANEVRLCVSPQCKLYPYRLGKRPDADNHYEGALLTPVKAIRARCLDCSGFMPSEVRRCFLPECVLYHYRMGKNPNCRKMRDVEQKPLPIFSSKTPTRLPGLEAKAFEMGHRSSRHENGQGMPIKQGLGHLNPIPLTNASIGDGGVALR